MQNRYVGDIGDYLKLGILRALSPGFHLGIAWWLFPDESHNRDGRHIGYLDRPDQWRHFDPDLFDTLREIVSSGRRHVRELEAADVLPGAMFASEFIPRRWTDRSATTGATGMVGGDPKEVGASRSAVPRSRQRTGTCRFSPHGSQIRQEHHDQRGTPTGEARAMPDRLSPPVSSQGGHHAEMQHWADRLRASGFVTVDALRARSFSPRLYFLLDAPPLIRQRAEQIAVDWQNCITWHPGGDAPIRVREMHQHD